MQLFREKLCELVKNYKYNTGHRDGQVLQNSWMEIRQVLNLSGECMFWVHPNLRGSMWSVRVLMLKTSVTIFTGKGSTNEPNNTKSSIWIRRHFDRPCVWFGLYFVSILTHAKENCFTTINWQFLSFLFKPLFTWKEALGKCFTERKETTGNVKKKSDPARNSRKDSSKTSHTYLLCWCI